MAAALLAELCRIGWRLGSGVDLPMGFYQLSGNIVSYCLGSVEQDGVAMLTCCSRP
jgi:hypothetical protein